VTHDEKDLLQLLAKMVLRVMRVQVTDGEDEAVRRCVRRLEMEGDRVRDEARAEIAMRFAGRRHR
jgi:hypothetical protein